MGLRGLNGNTGDPGLNGLAGGTEGESGTYRPLRLPVAIPASSRGLASSCLTGYGGGVGAVAPAINGPGLEIPRSLTPGLAESASFRALRR